MRRMQTRTTKIRIIVLVLSFVCLISISAFLINAEETTVFNCETINRVSCEEIQLSREYIAPEHIVFTYNGYTLPFNSYIGAYMLSFNISATNLNGKIDAYGYLIKCVTDVKLDIGYCMKNNSPISFILYNDKNYSNIDIVISGLPIIQLKTSEIQYGIDDTANTEEGQTEVFERDKLYSKTSVRMGIMTVFDPYGNGRGSKGGIMLIHFM